VLDVVVDENVPPVKLIGLPIGVALVTYVPGGTSVPVGAAAGVYVIVFALESQVALEKYPSIVVFLTAAVTDVVVTHIPVVPVVPPIFVGVQFAIGLVPGKPDDGASFNVTAPDDTILPPKT
jgi:hypothetical protein